MNIRQKKKQAQNALKSNRPLNKSEIIWCQKYVKNGGLKAGIHNFSVMSSRASVSVKQLSESLSKICWRGN